MSRFLFVLPSTVSPAGSQIVDLAGRLTQHGHYCVIATQALDERSVRKAAESALKLVEWPEGMPSAVSGLRYVSKVVRAARPHVVVSQFWSVNLALPIGFAYRVPARVAWYHTLAGASAIDAGGRSLGWHLRVRRRRLLYRAATSLISVSNVGVAELRSLFGVSERKCWIVPNGIEDLGFCPSRLPGPPRLIAIGRLVPTKNHQLLVRAFADVRKAIPNATLTIIGDGPLRSLLDRLATRIGVRDSITFHPKASHAVAMAQLREAHALVHPSAVDNCPIVVQEAMCIGIPVVATDVGGVRELVGDEEGAVLVRPDDRQALARAICGVLTHDAARRDSMVRVARAEFERRLTRETFVDRAAAVMEAIRPPVK